jgi:hypothetical protein
MMDILRDSIWQFAGAIFGLVAILVSVIFFLAQRKRKSLAYEVVTNTPLLSVAEEIKGKLKILYEDKLVSKVQLVLLKLTNTGNIPILSSDFDREVSFSFGASTQILSAEISDTEPKDNSDASIVINGFKVIVKPILFNSGDSITVRALLGQFDGKIIVDGRIVGVKEISEKKEKIDWKYFYLRFPFIMGALFLLTILGLLVPSIKTFTTNIVYLIFAILVIVTVVISIRDFFVRLFHPPSKKQ